MTKYTEILRLHGQGVSGRGIAASCGCSRNTVSNVLERAKHHEIRWPFEKDLTDQDLEDLLFPEKKLTSSRKMPDCEYIHKELAKSGVTLSLLWNEYCEKTRLSGEIPLMYSQFVCCIIEIPKGRCGRFLGEIIQLNLIVYDSLLD